MKNIVWLASYPKSGNTWFRMFLANYTKYCTIPASLEDIESTPIASSVTDFEEQIGLNPFELYPEEVDIYRPHLYRALSEEIEAKGKVCYKKVHDAYILNNNGEAIFPQEVSKYAIYFIRNPLDVCVSYANHSAGKIEKSVDFILEETSFIGYSKQGQLRQILLSWKNHIQSWKNQSGIPVYFTRYEDMLRTPEETFRKIVLFMELEYDEIRLKRAILNSDFKILQKMEKENGFKEKMQECKTFFWKGKIGNYRDYLSEEQINRIVEYNYDTMKEYGYIDNNGNLTV